MGLSPLTKKLYLLVPLITVNSIDVYDAVCYDYLMMHRVIIIIIFITIQHYTETTIS